MTRELLNLVFPQKQSGYYQADYRRLARKWYRVTSLTIGAGVALCRHRVIVPLCVAALFSGVRALRYDYLRQRSRKRPTVIRFETGTRVSNASQPQQRVEVRTLRELTLNLLLLWSEQGTLPAYRALPPSELANELAVASINRNYSTFRGLIGKVSGVTALDLEPLSGELTDSDLKEIRTAWPELTMLLLGKKARGLNAKSLPVLAGFGQLRVLDLRPFSYDLDARALEAIRSSNPGLVEVRLHHRWSDATGCTAETTALHFDLSRIWEGQEIDPSTQFYNEWRPIDADLLRLVEGKTSLRRLGFGPDLFLFAGFVEMGASCGCTSSSTWAAIADQCPKLQSIDLCLEETIFSQTMEKIKGKLLEVKELKVLILGRRPNTYFGGVGFTAERLKELTEVFPALHHLKLCLDPSDYEASSDELFLRYPHLKRLDVTLSEQASIEDREIESLIRRWPELTHVRYGHCSFTIAQVRRLVDGLPKLRSLKFGKIIGAITELPQLIDPLSRLQDFSFEIGDGLQNGILTTRPILGEQTFQGVQAFLEMAARMESSPFKLKQLSLGVLKERLPELCAVLRMTPYAYKVHLDVVDRLEEQEWQALAATFGERAVSLTLSGEGIDTPALRALLGRCRRLKVFGLSWDVPAIDHGQLAGVLHLAPTLARITIAGLRADSPLYQDPWIAKRLNEGIT